MKTRLMKIIVAVVGCGLAVCGRADAVQGRISVEVAKTVAWSEGPNAIIAIDVHSTPEVRVKTPNVLMLGSLCYKHGLTPAIVKRALDTLAQVANVDYDGAGTDPSGRNGPEAARLRRGTDPEAAILGRGNRPIGNLLGDCPHLRDNSSGSVRMRGDRFPECRFSSIAILENRLGGRCVDGVEG